MYGKENYENKAKVLHLPREYALKDSILKVRKDYIKILRTTYKTKHKDRLYIEEKLASPSKPKTSLLS